MHVWWALWCGVCSVPSLHRTGRGDVQHLCDSGFKLSTSVIQFSYLSAKLRSIPLAERRSQIRSLHHHLFSDDTQTWTEPTTGLTPEDTNVHVAVRTAPSCGQEPHGVNPKCWRGGTGQKGWMWRGRCFQWSSRCTLTLVWWGRAGGIPCFVKVTKAAISPVNSGKDKSPQDSCACLMSCQRRVGVRDGKRSSALAEIQTAVLMNYNNIYLQNPVLFMYKPGS